MKRTRKLLSTIMSGVMAFTCITAMTVTAETTDTEEFNNWVYDSYFELLYNGRVAIEQEEKFIELFSDTIEADSWLVEYYGDNLELKHVYQASSESNYETFGIIYEFETDDSAKVLFDTNLYPDRFYLGNLADSEEEAAFADSEEYNAIDDKLKENGSEYTVSEYNENNLYIEFDGNDKYTDNVIDNLILLNSLYGFKPYYYIPSISMTQMIKYYDNDVCVIEEIENPITPVVTKPIEPAITGMPELEVLTATMTVTPQTGTTTYTTVTTMPELVPVSETRYITDDPYYTKPDVSYTITTRVEPVIEFGIASLQGDVDCNGDIEIADLTHFSKYLLNWEIFPLSGPVANSNADINNDYKHNASDSTLMVEMILNH